MMMTMIKFVAEMFTDPVDMPVGSCRKFKKFIFGCWKIKF